MIINQNVVCLKVLIFSVNRQQVDVSLQFNKVCTTFYPQGISDCVLLSRTERNGVKRVFSLSRAFLRAREPKNCGWSGQPGQGTKGTDV